MSNRGAKRVAVKCIHPTAGVLYAHRVTETLAPIGEPFIMAPGLWLNQETLSNSGWKIQLRAEDPAPKHRAHKRTKDIT